MEYVLFQGIHDICHLLKTSQDNFRVPPPKYFQKRNKQLIYDICMYIFDKYSSFMSFSCI